MLPKELTLPPLRSDIQLNEAPPEPEGSPSWTLYDPAANKYYKIGWMEFECLSRFGTCRTAKDLVKKLEQETTLQIDEDVVAGLVSFLIHHNLIVTAGEGIATYFGDEKAKREKAWWETILHGYLFFTIPLFKPQRFLEKTFPYIKFLFTRQFMTGVVALFLYGVFLSIQRFDEFSTTFMSYFSIEGVILFLVATILVKIVHELGHAYTATKYGVPVPVMGVAVMVMYPVLYSEITNAWKLQSRTHRIHIAAAGVMSELALASVALVLWHILAPGLAQSLCFMIAVVSLLASVAVNFNPLMRFDGYYLFSDIVGIDNLQDRSFALAKWKIRRVLWNWQDEPPEIIPLQRQNFMISFGFAILIYRFLLYAGIALMVYHLFFQPLGLILMLVECAFFIALPVVREIKVWWKRKDEISASKRSRIYAVLLGFFVLLAFMPVRTTVEVPAVFHAQSYKRIFAPTAARIDKILVLNNQTVEEGAILFMLSAPQLEYSIGIARQRLKSLYQIRDSGQANLELAQKRMTLDSEIDAGQKELEGLLTQKDQLHIKASYTGVIKDMDPTLHEGQWISGDHMLGLIVDDRRPVLAGYIREHDITRIVQGQRGTFYPDYSMFQRYEVILTQQDEAGTSEISWPELASVHNGPLPAERDGRGGVRSLPRYTLYAARFEVGQNSHNGAPPDFVARGTVRLRVKRTSAVNMLIKRTISVVIRESGF